MSYVFVCACVLHVSLNVLWVLKIVWNVVIVVYTKSLFYCTRNNIIDFKIVLLMSVLLSLSKRIYKVQSNNRILKMI